MISDKERAKRVNSFEPRELVLELLNPFGQPIHTFRFVETHGEYGGLGSLANLMWAHDLDTFIAPFHVPGTHPGASHQMRFTSKPLTVAQQGRHARKVDS